MDFVNIIVCIEIFEDLERENVVSCVAHSHDEGRVFALLDFLLAAIRTSTSREHPSDFWQCSVPSTAVEMSRDHHGIGRGET